MEDLDLFREEHSLRATHALNVSLIRLRLDILFADTMSRSEQEAQDEGSMACNCLYALSRKDMLAVVAALPTASTLFFPFGVGR